MKIPNSWVTFGKLRGHLVFIFSFLTYKVLLAVCRTSLSRAVLKSSASTPGLSKFEPGPAAMPGTSTARLGRRGRPVTLRFVASYVTSDKSLNFSKPGFAHL